MINYETFCKIQHYANDRQLKPRQIAKALGLDRRTVTYWIKEKQYRPAKSRQSISVLDPYKDHILAWLEQHDFSAQQIYQKLQAIGFEGKYGIVLNFVNKVRPKRSPAFLSLVFAPGECAQVDWGEYDSISVGNTRRKLSFFAMVLCHSRLLYVEFCVSKTMEHFLGAHQRAFEFIGGVPKTIMVDNLKSAVIRRIIGEAPVFNPKYLAFAKHYGFTIKACGIAKGNEKGRVENAVGYIKKNFLKGLDLKQFAPLNSAAHEWMNNIANKRLHGTTKKVPQAEFSTIERQALQSLPGLPFDIGTITAHRVTKQFRVHFDSNRYSVPARYASQRVIVKAYPDRLVIYDQDQCIAEHPRSFDRHQDFEHPDHPKSLLQYRRQARDQKIYQRFIELSPNAYRYYQQLELRRVDTAHHIRQIVALSEVYGADAAGRTIEDALELQVYSSDYILNILSQRQRIKAEPGPLHLTRRQDLLEITLKQPDLTLYDSIKKN